MKIELKRVPWIVPLILLLGLLVWMFSAKREPVYNRKTLGEWAQQYGSNHWSGLNREADAEAEGAIRKIGTNAVPFLLSRLRTRESVFKQSARKILPASWHTRLRLRDDSGEVRRVGAHGFAALGTNAGVAVPQLIEIGRNHPEEDGRYVAVFALRTLGEAAEPAIPFFIECLTNQTAIIRGDAALGLGAVNRQPEIVLAALIRYLQMEKTQISLSNFELSDTLGILGYQFGPAAKAAVPEVVTLLTHTEMYVREAATNCLLQIDPEAAVKAGVAQRRD
jgi:HEAT repeat protein